MGRYRRTVSFPNPIQSTNTNSNLNSSLNPAKSYHVRSVSLPCGRTHPLIPQLRDEVSELRAWVGSGDRAGLAGGLARLKSVLDSLDDVLQLPQTQESLLLARPDFVEVLLEDFLKYVDVYEVFHAAMLGLKQEVSTAQINIRGKNDSKMGLFVKAHKKIAGDVGKLISTVGSLPQRSNGLNNLMSDFHEELVGVINDVHRLTASVSEAVFGAVSGPYGPRRKNMWAGLGLRKGRKEEGGVEEFVKVLSGVENLMEVKRRNEKNYCGKKEEVKMEVLKKMEEMEDFVGEMERESERVLRSLISNRVSLLNILTHA